MTLGAFYILVCYQQQLQLQQQWPVIKGKEKKNRTCFNSVGKQQICKKRLDSNHAKEKLGYWNDSNRGDTRISPVMSTLIFYYNEIQSPFAKPDGPEAWRISSTYFPLVIPDSHTIQLRGVHTIVIYLCGHSRKRCKSDAVVYNKFYD